MNSHPPFAKRRDLKGSIQFLKQLDKENESQGFGQKNL
jgi:hypothetical protein